MDQDVIDNLISDGVLGVETELEGGVSLGVD
jgi:hypothetical protein